MTPNEYQKEAHKTSKYHIAVIEGTEYPYVYPVLGLAEEAGEVAGKFAKAVRDDNGVISEQRKLEILKELGDVQWFVAELCTLLGADLEIVMQLNIAKLKDRAERGVISGSGDNR